jgi:truncated hemoglobin YjbI
MNVENTTPDETKEDGPDLLHQGTLLSKLGGVDAVKVAVEEMYKRMVEDPETAFFFEDINMAFLKQHQIDFLKIAFTIVPDDLDVPSLLRDKHAALFKRGLNAKHFDVAAKHFVGSMLYLDVPQELINEAVSIIGPLRVVFEEGAETAQTE